MYYTECRLKMHSSAPLHTYSDIYYCLRWRYDVETIDYSGEWPSSTVAARGDSERRQPTRKASKKDRRCMACVTSARELHSRVTTHDDDELLRRGINARTAAAFRDPFVIASFNDRAHRTGHRTRAYCRRPVVTIKDTARCPPTPFSVCRASRHTRHLTRLASEDTSMENVISSVN